MYAVLGFTDIYKFIFTSFTNIYHFEQYKEHNGNSLNSNRPVFIASDVVEYFMYS